VRRITWLGHSTVLIETGGVRLLTDPVLRGRVAHLRRQVAPAGDVGRVDAVLLSHLHRDHLDLPTLRGIDAPLVVPRGAASAVRSLGRDVQEVAAGESVTVGGVVVRAVPAVHDGRRVPVGPPIGALGYVADGIYFAGDTETFDGMAALGPLDVALVPIWGWGTSLGPGHMDPEQAAEAVALLRPRVVVPIHWGTLLPLGRGRSHGHLLREPVERFVAACARVASGARVEVLEPGAALELEPHAEHAAGEGADRGAGEGDQDRGRES
jgi:L-ascorbate metabolism protein UlaG (beta-lactamase superfamily)